jgi:hypothetical protein
MIVEDWESLSATMVKQLNRGTSIVTVENMREASLACKCRMDVTYNMRIPIVRSNLE